MAETGLSTNQTTGEPPLRIVLVNNMADAAMAITERRFQRLLQAAFPHTPIDFRSTTLPAIPRSDVSAARIARHYITLDELHAAPPDAILFSGAEPIKSSFHDEVFWPQLTKLFDWVRDENIPSLFSCLAAHAAVFHYDGIERRRMPEKTFGFFAQTIAADHPLLDGMPEHFTVAHSRWNDLDSEKLTVKNYRILTHNPQIGVDMFVPGDQSPQIFLQGHPEYEDSALDGEYNRDLKRFEAGESTYKPRLPKKALCESSAWAGSASTAIESSQACTSAGNFKSVFQAVIRNWVQRNREMVA